MEAAGVTPGSGRPAPGARTQTAKPPADASSRPAMRFLTRPRIQWAGGGLAAWLALAGAGAGAAAAALDVVRTTKAAPAGFVEIGGVEAGAFNPAIWQAGTLHWVPALAAAGTAEREVSQHLRALGGGTPGGYRLYGAWTACRPAMTAFTAPRRTRISRSFPHRRAIIVPGGYVHVCNVNALGLDGGGFELLATVHPAGTEQAGLLPQRCHRHEWERRAAASLTRCGRGISSRWTATPTPTRTSMA